MTHTYNKFNLVGTVEKSVYINKITVSVNK